MKKRYQSFVLATLVALMALALAACGGGSTPEPTPEPLQSYSSGEMGFAIDYPASWVQTVAPDGMVEFKSSASVNLDINYTGGSMVQVATIPTFFLDSTDPVEVLGLFTEDMLEGMRAEDDEAKIVQNATAVTVNGLPAAKMVAEAQQGTIKARAEVYMIVEGESAGLVMAIYPASEASTYEGTIQRIVNTFSFVAEE